MPARSRKPRRVALKGSKKAPFTAGKRVGRARKDEEVTVTLRLRRNSARAPARWRRSSLAFLLLGHSRREGLQSVSFFGNASHGRGWKPVRS